MIIKFESEALYDKFKKMISTILDFNSGVTFDLLGEIGISLKGYQEYKVDNKTLLEALFDSPEVNTKGDKLKLIIEESSIFTCGTDDDGKVNELKLYDLIEAMQEGSLAADNAIISIKNEKTYYIPIEVENLKISDKKTGYADFEISIKRIISPSLLALLINGVGKVDFGYFIRVKANSDIDTQSIDDIASAYIWELHKEKPVKISKNKNFFKVIEQETDADRDVFPPENINLNLSKGAVELYNMYNRSRFLEVSSQIVEYCKILEYIGSTLFGIEQINKVIDMLKENHKPDAEYANRLVKLVKNEFKKSKNDENIITEVVKTVLKKNQSYKELTYYKEKINDENLTKIGKIISKTRNMLVHAKINYEKIGEECDEGDFIIFEPFLRYIAHESIVYFTNEIDEDLRFTVLE